MVTKAHFERDDILGNWYPTNCVIALIGAEDARTAIAALREKGFDGDTVRHWESKQMLDFIAAKEHEGGIKAFFRGLQRAMTDDEGALNVYEQGARYGQGVIAVYAPNDQARDVAHRLLSVHRANYIKYYGAFAVTDLS